MKNNIPEINVGVLGIWHLGSVYSTALAHQGYNVVGFDLNQETIKNLNLGVPPIYEPNLENYLKQHLNRNLYFTKVAKKAIKDKKYIFITLDIDVNDQDNIDSNKFNQLFRLIVKYISDKTTIVISSQIPVGTTRSLINKFASKEIQIIYFPENLRLGNAFADFLNPQRIILGADRQEIIDGFLSDFNFFHCPILKMSVESAEMVKHALNSYLALNISFAIELGNICVITGADMVQVVEGLKSDERIGNNARIDPGLGFAGGTLGRDLKSLIKISQKNNYTPKLLRTIYQVNQDGLKNLIKKIRLIYPTLKNKKIGILGLTYKPNTNTLRRSFSLEIAKQLSAEKAKIYAFDPVIKSLDSKYNYIKLATSIDDLLTGLDMLILMTEWNDFKKIDLNKASVRMQNKIVIDTKNFLNKTDYLSHGFKYFGVGRNI